MNIVFKIFRKIEINDQFKIVNMQTSCRNIGGYEYVELTGFHIVYDSKPFFLRQISHEKTCFISVNFKPLSDLGNLVFSIAEDNGIFKFFFFQYAEKQFELFMSRHVEQLLADLFNGNLFGFNLNLFVLIHLIPGQIQNPCIKGSAEKHCSSFFRFNEFSQHLS